MGSTATTTSTASTASSPDGLARPLAALIAAALLALLNVINFVGAGYARFASDRLDRPDAASTATAARIASGWPPWSSSHTALHAWVLTERREAEGAQAAYLKALRLAPGDPLLWSEYALALARLGRFDDAMTRAVVQAQALAPTSTAVRRAMADLGLSYWARGTPEQRTLWLKDMGRELAGNRTAFLGHVVTRGQLKTFCSDAAKQLKEESWCETMTTALRARP